MYSLTGYKRTQDDSRMTADNILNLYLTEIQFRTAKDLIQHMIDLPKQPMQIQEVSRATRLLTKQYNKNQNQKQNQFKESSK